MRAAVYFGKEDIRASEVTDPSVSEPHQMLVRVDATSICGSDLHLYRGALDPIMKRGHSRTGHELIGTVIETGTDVGRFKAGDRVTMGYSCSCGECYMCAVGQTAHCETTKSAVYGFGVAFGDLNGTHAEALILPHADGHALRVPDTIDDAAALCLSCSLPSALIANQLAAIEPGERVAIIGCGPTGLMCLDIALARSAQVSAFDPVAHRRACAEAKGACTFDPGSEAWREEALGQVSGRGFDKVIEVVGYPETLAMALQLVRPGGTVAAIGVFCDESFDLPLADVFLRDISLHMNGFANVKPYMWEALRLLERGTVDPREYFTHDYRLEDVGSAFRTFHGKADGVVKVLIRP